MTSDDDPPEVQWDEDIPESPPDDRGGESEVADDQPLGAPAGLDPEDAPLPGFPEAEPPSSG
ncbi:MAG: hypothetical protein ACR2NB_13590 [Solirubrobacteraceae bacterium]